MQNLMNQNTLIVVLAIVLIIWLGLAVYLFIIDRKVKKLESVIDWKNSTEE